MRGFDLFQVRHDKCFSESATKIGRHNAYDRKMTLQLVFFEPSPAIKYDDIEGGEPCQILSYQLGVHFMELE